MRIGNSICIHDKLEDFCIWHRIWGTLWVNPPQNLFFTDLLLYCPDCFSAVSCLWLVHDFLQFKGSITSKPSRRSNRYTAENIRTMVFPLETPHMLFSNWQLRSGGQVSTTHKSPLLPLPFQKEKLKKKKKKAQKFQRKRNYSLELTKLKQSLP